MEDTVKGSLEIIQRANPKLAEMMRQQIKTVKEGDVSKERMEVFLRKARGISKTEIPNMNKLEALLNKLD